MPRHMPPLLAGLTIGLICGSIVAMSIDRPAFQSDSTQPTVAAPDPRWSPADVVRFQMDALRRTPHEAEGFEHCYRFASPENREAVGTLQQFQSMLTRQYAPLLGHHQSVIGSGHIEGNSAAVLATGIAADGSFLCYQFMLSKQLGGGFDDCWMTDSVIAVPPNVEVNPNQPPASAPRTSELGPLG